MNLDFLDEIGEEEEGRAEEGVTGDGAPSAKAAEGCSKATPPLEVVHAFVSVKAVPISSP